MQAVTYSGVSYLYGVHIVYVHMFRRALHIRFCRCFFIVQCISLMRFVDLHLFFGVVCWPGTASLPRMEPLHQTVPQSKFGVGNSGRVHWKNVKKTK